MPAFGILQELESALEPSGIRLRGVVSFAEGEGPSLDEGGSALSVVLLGNVGGSIWPGFAAWRRDYFGSDPLDAWSKAVIGPVAERLGATAFYPSDPPYMPFQRWAMRAEGLKASPLGILIHPRYGLWHGYRGALAFRDDIGTRPSAMEPSPCDTCAGKPCLSACPAGAISLSGFAVDPCRAHLVTAEGQAGCMSSGCVARNACPVGAGYRYPEAQLRFHMDALFS
ncbi:ferredoxin [Rhizobium sp. C4]|uniref:ferredoxin n=1 Tax=Rhizobium sp. C4 TaxID=1349800 RepID=UPI001E2B3AF5|nr:ferredoxin [Rhizobium sp. C4]MCD2173293.1 ferredoxin [Rhizobium sp. C4]